MPTIGEIENAMTPMVDFSNDVYEGLMSEIEDTPGTNENDEQFIRENRGTIITFAIEIYGMICGLAWDEDRIREALEEAQWRLVDAFQYMALDPDPSGFYVLHEAEGDYEEDFGPDHFQIRLYPVSGRITLSSERHGLANIGILHLFPSEVFNTEERRADYVVTNITLAEGDPVVLTPEEMAMLVNNNAGAVNIIPSASTTTFVTQFPVALKEGDRYISEDKEWRFSTTKGWVPQVQSRTESRMERAVRRTNERMSE